jgi:hypothetical protein
MPVPEHDFFFYPLPSSLSYFSYMKSKKQLIYLVFPLRMDLPPSFSSSDIADLFFLFVCVCVESSDDATNPEHHLLLSLYLLGVPFTPFDSLPRPSQTQSFFCHYLSSCPLYPFGAAHYL